MAGRPQISSRTGPGYKLAEFMNDNWDDIVGRTNEDVSQEIGYKSPNMISMWRTGKASIPLHILPDISRLMNVDIGILLPLWCDQFLNRRADATTVLSEIETRMVTPSEATLIAAVRRGLGHKDRPFTANSLDAFAALAADPSLASAVILAAAAKAASAT